jgi:hypothetical protein
MWVNRPHPSVRPTGRRWPGSGFRHGRGEGAEADELSVWVRSGGKADLEADVIARQHGWPGQAVCHHAEPLLDQAGLAGLGVSGGGPQGHHDEHIRAGFRHQHDVAEVLLRLQRGRDLMAPQGDEAAQRPRSSGPPWSCAIGIRTWVHRPVLSLGSRQPMRSCQPSPEGHRSNSMSKRDVGASSRTGTNRTRMGSLPDLCGGARSPRRGSRKCASRASLTCLLRHEPLAGGGTERVSHRGRGHATVWVSLASHTSDCPQEPSRSVAAMRRGCPPRGFHA